MKTNLLLTSVGRRVELVRAFQRAYQQLGLEGQIVATDIDPLAPAMQIVDVPLLVPNNRDPHYVDHLAELCAEYNIDLVLPLIDPDIPRLAAERAKIEAQGAKLGVVSVEAARICGDKWLAHGFFRQHNLATPQTWLPGQLDPEDAVYPLFVKPRDGSAAMHTFPARTPEELRFFENYVPNAIVQEFLEGPEITTDVVCDLHGKPLTVISRQRLAVRGGEVIKSVTVKDSRITEACKKIARQLPAVGPITVQCMMHREEPYLIEINARLGGGIPLAFAAGIDVPAILIHLAAGLPVQVPETYQTDLYMTRCDESFFVSATQLPPPRVELRPQNHAS
jgi:carbamoyl-phosphate synthase large subunit